MRTRIKICGITRPEDGLTAVRHGADAIGLVFYPPSPRYVTPEQAAEISSALPPFVSIVGLFVNADAETIREAVDTVNLDLIQFHGDECPEYCASHRRRWIKAIRMKQGLDLMRAAEDYRQAAALLLDAYQPGVPGGTGSTFNWDRIPEELAGQIILAGGLSPDNVEQAVCRVRPYAVDVSGGVESGQGIKDHKKIEQFIRGVRRVER